MVGEDLGLGFRRSLTRTGLSDLLVHAREEFEFFDLGVRIEHVRHQCVHSCVSVAGSKVHF